MSTVHKVQAHQLQGGRGSWPTSPSSKSPTSPGNAGTAPKKKKHAGSNHNAAHMGFTLMDMVTYWQSVSIGQQMPNQPVNRSTGQSSMTHLTGQSVCQVTQVFADLQICLVSQTASNEFQERGLSCVPCCACLFIASNFHYFRRGQ